MYVQAESGEQCRPLHDHLLFFCESGRVRVHEEDETTNVIYRQSEQMYQQFLTPHLCTSLVASTKVLHWYSSSPPL